MCPQSSTVALYLTRIGRRQMTVMITHRTDVFVIQHTDHSIYSTHAWHLAQHTGMSALLSIVAKIDPWQLAGAKWRRYPIDSWCKHLYMFVTMLLTLLHARWLRNCVVPSCSDCSSFLSVCLTQQNWVDVDSVRELNGQWIVHISEISVVINVYAAIE